MSNLPENCNVCPTGCNNVFDRVHVSYLIKGGTRVFWDLVDTFADPLPYRFQLQYSRNANQISCDWQDVGEEVENGTFQIDTEKRVWGRTQTAHYRVKLTTYVGEYYSEPTGAIGVLGKQDWAIAREIVRKERLRAKAASQDGFLLKRRSSGVKCPQCLDKQTGEITDPDCPECYGTGFQCGYFYPVPCVWADFDPRAHKKHLDDGGMRGVISDIYVKARMLMLPLLEEYDVWVNRKTDDRYYIRDIQHIAEWKGVPLIASVGMRPAAYSDVIYDIEIPSDPIDPKVDIIDGPTNVLIDGGGATTSFENFNTLDCGGAS